jgi:tryptophan-rich sensory protein
MARGPLRIADPARRGGWRVPVAIVLGVATTAVTGAIASIRAGEFYASLVKPSWAPPAGVFSPVWMTLYAMMAIAAWLAWRRPGRRHGTALAFWLFALQLVLNALWSWIFFAWHLGGLALLEICVLWFAILATLTQFWRLRPLAGALLVPYLLWVSFATALTAAVWRLNPGVL